jgi:hypothetical protein
MLTDERQIESRIKLLKSMNVNLEKDMRFADPILKITPKGRRVSSIKGQIESNKLEMKQLEQRLVVIRKHKANRDVEQR